MTYSIKTKMYGEWLTMVKNKTLKEVTDLMEIFIKNDFEFFIIEPEKK